MVISTPVMETLTFNRWFGGFWVSGSRAWRRHASLKYWKSTMLRGIDPWVRAWLLPSYTSGHGPIKGPIAIKLREVFVWDLGNENSEMPRIRLITCEWCEIRLMTMQELILRIEFFEVLGTVFFKHCLTKVMQWEAFVTTGATTFN